MMEEQSRDAAVSDAPPQEAVSPEASGCDWYVIRVRSGHEDEMISVLRPMMRTELGEEVFTMKKEKDVHYRGEHRIVCKAAFPGYIFFVTPDAAGMNEILKKLPLFGFLLKTNRQITPILPEEKEFLTVIGGKDHIVDISIGFKEGDEIGVVVGPLSAVKGRILKLDRHKRIAQIEVSLLGEPHPVWFGFRVLRSRSEAEELVRKGRRRDEMAALSR
ncbi:MAG: hypothetical protein IJQ12_02340 [Lachnospiraceae bacterium]|nr:hypothetical protein [Lachnospiraceae bacterium]